MLVLGIVPYVEGSASAESGRWNEGAGDGASGSWNKIAGAIEAGQWSESAGAVESGSWVGSAGTTKGSSLVKLTPDWDFPDGWAVTSWDSDARAERTLFVRGTDRIEHPQPNWGTRDLFVVDEDLRVWPVYGPDAGTEGDPISRIIPATSGDGSAAFFGTYRKEYPQGTDLRRWSERAGQEVVAGSGKNFDLDFPDVSDGGDRGAFVEILPLTLDNFVFKMRLYAWTEDEGPTMLAEYPNRHITGLALSANGGSIAYCLQDFSEDVDRGEIRLVDPDGTNRSVLSYVGVAGPVGISGDGSSVAAYLPDEPAEIDGPRSGVPGVFLWRQGEAPRRLDSGDGSANLRVPLTMSSDGDRVSWAGLVWSDGEGVTSVFDSDLGDAVVQARMSGDGEHWTVWLPEGPDGPGLYRLDASPSPAPTFLPRAER